MNFDSTIVGKPYSRIENIVIDYTAPTVGTDVPEMIIAVPPLASGVPGVYTLPIGFSGLRFNLGLGLAITGGSVDTDTTAVAVSGATVNLTLSRAMTADFDGAAAYWASGEAVGTRTHLNAAGYQIVAKEIRRALYRVRALGRLLTP